MTNKELIELIKRKAVNIFSVEGLEEKLNSGKKLRIKFGADPSRPDLHLGHSVPFSILKAFQDAGHQVIFVIGDFTAMIGDPSGKSKTRPSLTFEETRKNSETYLKQVGKLLDIKKVKVVYNSEWLEKMTFKDVISLSSKYTLARMLERDDFAKRYAENMPISMHEMLYPLMQGYDSVALEADVEIGGTDQTFNLLVGRELQRDYGQAPQEVATFPLLVGLDGKEKMSKSLDNYIGVSEGADIMFEKAMKVPDDVLLTYFTLTTDYNLDKAKKLIETDIMKAHTEYAMTITKMYNSEEDAVKAYERYKSVASGGIPENIEITKMGKKECQLIDCLMATKLCVSTSEARRMVQQNAIKVNGVVVNDFRQLLDLTKDTVIQKGKNKFAKVTE